MIFGLMSIFCLLNNILYWTDYDEDGNYKYMPYEDLTNEKEKLQNDLKKYDVTNASDSTMYVTIQTKLDVIELQAQFSKTSWQYRKLNVYLYDTIYQLNWYRYVDKENDSSKTEEEYQNILKRLKDDDWKYFLETQKEKLTEEQKDLEKQLEFTSDKQQKLELEQLISETKSQLKILNYRLKNEIPEDNSFLNLALESYQENNKTVEFYELSHQNKTYQEELQYRSALAEKEINQYIIGHKQNINKQNTLNYQLRTIIEDYEIFIVILILMISSTIICDEFRDGTIKLLLIKPYSRGKILLGKYLASIIVLGISIIFLIAIQFAIGGILFGIDSLNMPVVVYHFKLSKLVTYPVFSYMIIRVLAKLPLLLILLTISICLGVLFSSNVISITIPLMLYMFSYSLHSLAVQYQLKFMKYIISMNWSFEDYLFGGISDFSFINLKFSCIIWFVYFIIIGLLAYFCFKKKNIRNI